MIIRDYHMAFWLSPDLSTQDPIIIQRALARGLIMVGAINKKPCYNLFITYSNLMCIEFYFEDITIQRSN